MAAKDFGFTVEYWDQDVAVTTKNPHAQGWMMEVHTDDEEEAIRRHDALEEQGWNARIIMDRPERIVPPNIRHRSTPVPDPGTRKTLFQQYGQVGIAAICEGGYSRFLEDPLLKEVFSRYDVEVIKRKVRATFAIVLGAADRDLDEARQTLGVRPGRTLNEALTDMIVSKHAPLNLTMDHMVRVAEGFKLAALDAGVTRTDANTIYAAVMSFAPKVVTA